MPARGTLRHHFDMYQHANDWWRQFYTERDQRLEHVPVPVPVPPAEAALRARGQLKFTVARYDTPETRAWVQQMMGQRNSGDREEWIGQSVKTMRRYAHRGNV